MRPSAHMSLIAAAMGIVRRWLAETGFEYPAVAALISNEIPGGDPSDEPAVG